MDTITGGCPTETERYGDEVLNASWLPHGILTPRDLQSVNTSTHRQTRSTRCFGSDLEAEDFMQQLYRCQE